MIIKSIILVKANKTTNIYKQNPACNGYYIISELGDVLQSDFSKSPLGFDNVDWFAKDIIKTGNKLAFYFKNTRKDTIKTNEDEEDYRINNICRFCEKNIESDKVGDHCLWLVNIEVQLRVHVILMLHKNKGNFIPFVNHSFNNYDCHLVFEKLVDKKMIKWNPELYLERMKKTYQ